MQLQPADLLKLYTELVAQNKVTEEKLKDLTGRHERLLEKGRKMRGYQKEYFKYRAGSDLKFAKRFAREFDRLLEQEIKIQESNQKELF